jgi:hypothetical protein
LTASHGFTFCNAMRRMLVTHDSPYKRHAGASPPQRALDRLSDLSRLSPDLTLEPFRPQSCRGSVDLGYRAHQVDLRFCQPTAPCEHVELATVVTTRKVIQKLSDPRPARYPACTQPSSHCSSRELATSYSSREVLFACSPDNTHMAHGVYGWLASIS